MTMRVIIISNTQTASPAAGPFTQKNIDILTQHGIVKLKKTETLIVSRHTGTLLTDSLKMFKTGYGYGGSKKFMLFKLNTVCELGV